MYNSKLVLISCLGAVISFFGCPIMTTSAQALNINKIVYKDNFFKKYVPFIVSQNNLENSEILLKRAINLIDQKKYKLAHELLIKSTQYSSNNANIWFYSGKASLNLGNFKRAINEFSTSLKIKPSSTHSLTLRGAAYDHLGDFRSALQDYNNAIIVDPNYYPALYERALLYSQVIRDYNLAIKDLNKCLEGNYSRAKSLTEFSYIYLQLKKYDSAIYYANQAIAENPKESNAYNNRGAAYQNLGKTQLAILDFKKALSLDHRNKVALDNLAKFTRINSGIVNHQTPGQTSQDSFRKRQEEWRRNDEEHWRWEQDQYRRQQR